MNVHYPAGTHIAVVEADDVRKYTCVHLALLPEEVKKKGQVDIYRYTL